MKLHHPLLQLASLIGGEAEIIDIVWAVVVLVVVSQLSLNGVGAQQGMSDERARQSAWQHVIPQLQTQVVSVRRDKGGGEKGVGSQTSMIQGKLQQVFSVFNPWQLVAFQV